MNVAERYDVIIDFAAVPAGSKLYLKETATQNVNPGNVNPPGLPPGLNIGNVLMRFDVVNTESRGSQEIHRRFRRRSANIRRSARRTLRSSGSLSAILRERVPRLFRINNRVFDSGSYRSTAFSRAPAKSGCSTITSAVPPGLTPYTFTSRNFVL